MKKTLYLKFILAYFIFVVFLHNSPAPTPTLIFQHFYYILMPVAKHALYSQRV